MRELSVVGVRVELPSNQPIVLLREVEGDRYLPIWIGAVEATAIAYEQQGVKPARPLTHDLMRDILAALKAPLQAVEIMEMKENIFYADLLIGDGVRVSARPSDSIALALRVGRADPLRRAGAHRGRHRHPGRAGGRGREVPRVPRAGPPGGLRRLTSDLSPSGLPDACRLLVVGVSRQIPDRGDRQLRYRVGGRDGDAPRAGTHAGRLSRMHAAATVIRNADRVGGPSSGLERRRGLPRT